MTKSTSHDTKMLWQALEKWHEFGWLRALDLNFGRYLASRLATVETQADTVAILAVLVSHKLGQGHPCLDLQACSADPEGYLQVLPEQLLSNPQRMTPEQQQWRPANILSNCDVDAWVILLRDSYALTATHAPLVLTHQQLYFRRYWSYEQAIAADLQQRMTTAVSFDQAQLKNTLTRLFGPPQPHISWQRSACAMAVRSLFTIITGGPGTGKTYTVVRLLLTLQRLRQQQAPLTIKLAAPTGKAAARMTESIMTELAQLPAELGAQELDFNVSEDAAVTLHRLLGSQRHTREFRHHQHHPLALDVLIIDEASMVDIEMMAAVLAAVPDHARVILLGDKDQLASVEAGAVLGQLCNQAEQGHYHPSTANWLQQVTGESIPTEYVENGLDTSAVDTDKRYLQHVVMLRESRRFDAEQGIGKLAHQVNQQQTQWLGQWLNNPVAARKRDPSLANIALLHVAQAAHADFRQFVLDGLQPLSACLQQRPHDDATDADFNAWAVKVLEQLGQFQILTAVRSGEWGMHSLNEVIGAWMRPPQQGAEQWYHGRPVMLTRNDYHLDLRNGDIGIVLQRRSDEPLRVVFPKLDKQSGEQTVRWLMPSRLSHVDSVYAMTVHKSQGSEFSHTVLVLPPQDTPILTKELLYTGITRAKQHFTLIAARPDLVLTAVARRVERRGGL